MYSNIPHTGINIIRSIHPPEKTAIPPLLFCNYDIKKCVLVCRLRL